MVRVVNINCTYKSLMRYNRNFKERYKINNKSEFQPICELMDALGIPENKKQQFFEQYYVPDLIGKDCEVLFVLESPHTDEIIHKHPLAGSSGLNLSKGLIEAGLIDIKNSHGCYLPFGCWLQENINTDLGKKIGIMNVCNFPMQSKAYSCTFQNIGNLKILNNIKKHDFTERKINSSDINKDTYNILKNYIQVYFDNRLQKLHPKLIIVCGKLANNAIEVNYSANNTITIYQISHPSYWQTRGENRKIADICVLCEVSQLLRTNMNIKCVRLNQK